MMKILAIRLSHLLSHSGVGAIVRGPEGLITVQDIRNWTSKAGLPAGDVIPYLERARAALRINEILREPPLAKEVANGQVDGVCVPVTRFPFWMRCPAPDCGALYFRPWKHQNIDQPHCMRELCKRKPALEQVSWVLAHEAGYLADVPWQFLTHRDERAPERQDCKKSDQLRLTDHGFDRRQLHCDSCGALTKFDGSERVGFGNTRMQPWAHGDIAPAPESQEQAIAQVLQINDTRTYAPMADIVLVIPPESRLRKGTVVDRLYRNSNDLARIDKARTELARRAAVKTLTSEYRCGLDDIEQALADIRKGYPLYGASFTPGMLHESEFDAFHESLPDLRDDEDFVARSRSSEWYGVVTSLEVPVSIRNAVACIQTLIRVDRLKSVKIFRGFKRLGGNIVPADIIGTSEWLPAIQLYGEGIFIALDEQRLGTWEQHPVVATRLAQLLPRFVQAGREAPNPLTARFLLLHTLSHLLMRQIESEGGYPAAALTERIYCATNPKPMAGILIYVAVPDIAGSLGGLAELAEPKRFLGLLARAFDHSRWCSLDPVCSEHEGQGPSLLNRAACHACALVPEPACEYGNTLLDRVFVKGDSTNEFPSLFEMEAR